MITDVDVILTLDQAVSCGLILLELISNSLKHAFPGGTPGKIWIEFQLRNGAMLRYRDNGVGLSPDFDIWQTQSPGTQLITDLGAQLGAEQKYTGAVVVNFELTFTVKRGGDRTGDGRQSE